MVQVLAGNDEHPVAVKGLLQFRGQAERPRVGEVRVEDGSEAVRAQWTKSREHRGSSGQAGRGLFRTDGTAGSGRCP